MEPAAAANRRVALSMRPWINPPFRTRLVRMHEKESYMDSKSVRSAFVIASLLASTHPAAAQGTSGGTGAIASIPSSVVRPANKDNPSRGPVSSVFSPVRLRLALARFRNKKRSGTTKAHCLRSRKQVRCCWCKCERPVRIGAPPSGQRRLSDEPEPLYAQLSVEVAGGREGARGAASTFDAWYIPGDGHHRPRPLLSLPAAERKDFAISWRFRRRIRSAQGRSRQARGTGV